MKSFTYDLEGNEILIIFAYQALQRLRNNLDRDYDMCARVNAFIELREEHVRQQWIDLYNNIITPLRTKFTSRIIEVAPVEGVNGYLKLRSIFLYYFYRYDR